MPVGRNWSMLDPAGPTQWVCHVMKTRYNSSLVNIKPNVWGNNLSQEIEKTCCQRQRWIYKKKVGAISVLGLPEGGQLKAKQDGVVRPGASLLSLGGGGG